MRSFWKFVALFAYRHWVEGNPIKPVGIPGNRDPEHPCTAFEPRPIKWNDWGRCESDGHYLCRECCHFIRHSKRSDLIELKI